MVPPATAEGDLDDDKEIPYAAIQAMAKYLENKFTSASEFPEEQLDSVDTSSKSVGSEHPLSSGLAQLVEATLRNTEVQAGPGGPIPVALDSLGLKRPHAR
ncbi:hypothetical protein AYL99_05162 [Fonsecaea erecta]|uniref:Uncharacterized protein n=1 Tax=Fonsecaea erecta TaxID=1367422 RepID=A0A178ZK37_9EURO|nr:hypothetical protein AYL99_05162 [Fonsecaea erecta]OAP60160.1 hypothetical protein AYL99_05162 [Fonsecaea erecta]